MSKFGFIAIAGKPNAGKSTLINQIVGEKVAIVSWRPQTTRDKITGVVNGDGYQMVFIDTPGLHHSQNKLGDFMMKSVDAALKDVDVILYVVNGKKGYDFNDKQFLDTYTSGKIPIVVAVNKLDAFSKEELFPQLQQLASYDKIKAVVPISAKLGDGVKELLSELESLLPEGEPMFPADVYTDKTMRFMASEIIREKGVKAFGKGNSLRHRRNDKQV
jgi:GTP-binding protein Era